MPAVEILAVEVLAVDVLAFEPAYWLQTLIKLGVVALVIPTASIILGYVFLMKMMSFMQSRLGPMEAGPYGTLQLLADGVKFLQKEDVFPRRADRYVFALAPAVVMVSTFLLYVVLPFGPDAVVSNLDAGLFFALAVASLSVIGILMAGWGSANKYALMGGMRAAGQLIAYELPLVLAAIGVVIQAGTLDLNKIVLAQATGEIFGWGAIGNPFILTQFVGFAIFLVAVQAELTQPPFDMPVAESEIVGGYQVEYTGFRFPVLLHGRVRHGVRLRRDRLGAVPGRLVRAGPGPGLGLVQPHRPVRDVHQDHRGLGAHLLVPLHLPAPAGGPTPEAGLEGAHPAGPAEHRGHGHPEGGGLMGVVEMLGAARGITGVGAGRSTTCTTRTTGTRGTTCAA